MRECVSLQTALCWDLPGNQAPPYSLFSISVPFIHADEIESTRWSE